MQYQYHDLKTVEKGKIIEVTLKYAANVRILDSSNYQNYKSGRKYQYIGGYVKQSPYRVNVPKTAHWYVVVDLGGYAGKIGSAVSVLPGIERSVSQNSLFSMPSLLLNRDDEGDKDYDVFISHASEDKDEIARPLAVELKNRGLSVWYDEFELKIGDSLRRKIDKGLANSRFGVVVISRNFINKGWANYELDGIITKTISDEQIMLPIWHNITKTEVINYSPSLADKLARNTAINTIEEIAIEIAELVKGEIA